MGFVNTGLALYTVVLLMTKLFICNGKKDYFSDERINFWKS